MKPRSRLAWFIAWRYLFSRKSHSIINIISIVTLTAIAVPTAAMIIVLSVYNGLDGVLKSLYSNFDTQIAILPAEGKFIKSDSLDLATIRAMDGVDVVSAILEDNVMLDYRGRQTVARIRGVDSSYMDMLDLDTLIIAGESRTELGDLDFAVVGMGIAYDLGINVVLYDKIDFYIPRRGGSSFLASDFYSIKSLKPNGVFALDEETDSRYVIVPLRFAESLLSRSGEVSQLGVSVKEGYSESRVIASLKSILGSNVDVKSRYQQKEGLYKVMAAEKLGVYFIIVMILIVASFTLIGAIVMLVSDKQNSIISLVAVGAYKRFIANIFFYQGLLITFGGVLLGLCIGVTLTLMQQWFGLIKIAGDSLLIDSYPVELRGGDLFMIVFTVISINAFISYLTIKLVVKR